MLCYICCYQTRSYDLPLYCVVYNKQYSVSSFQTAGFLVGIKSEAVKGFDYPEGSEWKKMFEKGLFKRE